MPQIITKLRTVLPDQSVPKFIIIRRFVCYNLVYTIKDKHTLNIYSCKAKAKEIQNNLQYEITIGKRQTTRW